MMKIIGRVQYVAVTLEHRLVPKIFTKMVNLPRGGQAETIA